MFDVLLKAIAGLALAGFINILYSWYTVRMMVRSLPNKHGIDILPHSFIFGHLLVIDQVMRKSKFPPNAHPQWLQSLMLEEYPDLAKKGILYLDIWPVQKPLLAIFEPNMCDQISDSNFPKDELMRNEFSSVTDAKDILTSEGMVWKRARSIFNPGFSAKNLISLIPEFVEELEVFRSKMKKVADTGKVIKLEDWATTLAADVIGRAVLGVRLDVQTNVPPLIETMYAQIPMLYNQLDFKKLFNPVRYAKIWIYRRRFRSQLLPYIKEASLNYEESTGPKTILKLALREAAKMNKNQVSASLDDFIEDQVGQFWIFLFAGQDTTAASFAYTLYLLSRNPEKAAKIREEHTRVLGSDPADAADRFREDPSLVNQLPYTTAVFKESLRLWPPVAGGVRQSPPGHFVTHPKTGQKYPTHGWMVNSAGATLHRFSEYWPEADSFVPERWLIRDPEDPMYPQKGAFRPFETGSRNCIGQELVNIEARLLLAMTAREFSIKDAYPEDGPTLFGEKGYSIMSPDSVAVAHAKDRMPVRIESLSLAKTGI